LWLYGVKYGAQDEQESIRTHVNGCVSMLGMMQRLTIALVEKVIEH